MYSAIVALDEHLGYACRATEVAVNLEWRVGIEEIAVCAALLLHLSVGHELVVGQCQLLLYELIGMVSVEHTCPEAYFPAHGPSGGGVATVDE